MRRGIFFCSGAAALAAATLTVSTASAAPVILQDYEAPDNLDAPFNLQPGYSGTSQGESLTTTRTLITDDGANGTSQSTEFAFTDDPGQTTPTSGGWDWQIRLIPNSLANAQTANPLFAADGGVGFYLKIAATVTADVQVAPVLEGPAGTGEATVGTLKTVIKDGQWHFYQWNMDSAAEFSAPWKDVYDDAASLGDGDLEATNSFDSIAFVSTNGGDLTFRMDEIQYDNAPVPEPAGLALFGLGAVLLRRRKA
jgi:hypothetical protein